MAFNSRADAILVIRIRAFHISIFGIHVSRLAYNSGTGRCRRTPRAHRVILIRIRARRFSFSVQEETVIAFKPEIKEVEADF